MEQIKENEQVGVWSMFTAGHESDGTDRGE